MIETETTNPPPPKKKTPHTVRTYSALKWDAGGRKTAYAYAYAYAACCLLLLDPQQNM